MAISEDPKVPPQDQLDADLREAFTLAPTDETVCFYCSSGLQEAEPIRHPAIFWYGDVQIWLHPRCAYRLAMGLLKDVDRLWDLTELANELRSRK